MIRNPAQRRVFLRLLRKSIVERKANVLFAFLAMTVGSTLLAALLNLTLDIEAKMNRELRGYGANLALTPRATLAGSFIGRDQAFQALALIPAADRVGAAPFLYSTMVVGDTAVVVAGTNFDEVRRVFPFWRVEGRYPEPEEVLVGRRAAEKLKVSTGSALQIAGTAAVVSGLISTGAAEEDQIFVHLNSAEQWAGAPGKLSMVAVSALGGFPAIEQFSEQIRARFAAIDAQPLRQIAISESETLRKIKMLMVTLSSVILLTSALSVTATLTYFVLEQSREIGLLKALGARNREVFSLFLWQALAIGLTGGLAGNALGIASAEWIGRRMFAAWIQPQPGAFVAVLAVSTAIALIASIPPIRRAVSIEPAVILRGE